MKIQWLGHSAFLLHGKDKVLIDPFLTGNPKAAVKPEDVDCDIVCITHGHFDHLGDAVAIARRTGAEVACIVERSLYLEKCSVKATGFNIGGSVKIKNTKVSMVPAFHSSSIGAPGLEFSAAMATGMVIDSGKVVYHAGDTAVFGDMALVGEMYAPDVALLPIGGFYTMDPAQAALATKLIGPKVVVPMHYSTWPPIEQDPREFERLVKKQSKAKVRIMAPGEVLEV